jgi:hypothetical protein
MVQNVVVHIVRMSSSCAQVTVPENGDIVHVKTNLSPMNWVPVLLIVICPKKQK